MPQSTVRLSASPARKLTIALIGAAAAIAAVSGVLFWWSSDHQGQAPSAQSDGSAFPWNSTGRGVDAAQANADAAALKLTEQEAHDQLVIAAKAAEKQVGSADLVGPIKERPEFVSQMEWVILRQVAARAPDSDKELTRLINNLRFMKHLEQWRALAGSADTNQRHALARQLLATLPARVSGAELPRSEAQQLQVTLLEDLVSDPAERARRVEEEGRRLVDPAPRPVVQQAG